MKRMYTDVADVRRQTRKLDDDISPERRNAAMRNICGARSCQGPEDAKIILEALGLINYKE